MKGVPSKPPKWSHHLKKKGPTSTSTSKKLNLVFIDSKTSFESKELLFTKKFLSPPITYPNWSDNEKFVGDMQSSMQRIDELEEQL